MIAANTDRRRRRRRPPASPSLPYLVTAAAVAAASWLPSATSRAATPRALRFDEWPRQRKGAGSVRMVTTSAVTTPDGTTYYSCSATDLDRITGPMAAADADGSGFLSQAEYVEFTNAISGGFLTEVGRDGSFLAMPLRLQETYLLLSCLCGLFPNQAWGGEGCCEGDSAESGIRTVGAGTDPGDPPPTRQERLYLKYVCGTMAQSLAAVGGELTDSLTRAPTTASEGGPATARPTTARPSRMPMASSTTAAPTSRPTDWPTPARSTRRPTRRPLTPPPSAEPTETPTKKPSKKPTDKPATPRPSERPTAQSTPEPSNLPTTNKPTTVDVNPRPLPTTERPIATALTRAPSSRPGGGATSPPSAAQVTPRPIVSDGDPSWSPVAGGPSRAPVAGPSTPGGTWPPTADSVVPTVSLPTPQPTFHPSHRPSFSAVPSVTAAPSGSPSATSSPTISAAPSAFTGEVPASVNFVGSLGGQVTAEEVMVGETNQVKVTLEEQLLELSEIVIEEVFHRDGADATAKSAVNNMSREGSTRRLVFKRHRFLVVENATSATVDSVQDVACPDDTNLNATCLNFNNTILLYMMNEPFVAEKVKVFESAMLAEIDAGWLKNNFDPEEALKPPVNKIITDPNPIEPSARLSAGAIVGIVLGVLLCFLVTILFAGRTSYKRENDAPPENHQSDYDLERQATPFKGSSDAEALDGLEVLPLASDDDDSGVHTAADQSYNSQDPLLASNQLSSSAAAPMSKSVMSPMPLLDEVSNDDGDDSSFYSVSGDGKKEGDHDILAGDSFYTASPGSHTSLDATPLAAMAAASTLVANAPSTKSAENPTREVPPHNSNESPSDDDSSSRYSIEREFNAVAGGTTGGRGTTATAKEASGAELTGDVCASTAPQQAGTLVAHGSEQEEFGVGAVAAGTGDNVRDGLAIGAVGLIRAGTQRNEDNSQVDATQSPQDSRVNSLAGASSAASFPPSAMDELDNAIGSGNWGHVGALAAVLASQRHGSHKMQSSRSATSGSGLLSSISPSKSDDSHNSHSGGVSLEQARAVEIDRLVESGDWQGVVLAAARFEADQTFDGESSFSATSGATSESSTGRWTGSATSATTPRSMATTSNGASNVSSQRGVAEIRAEVEALVRRVVPEEADNIDEMVTQFKGREEELVETLRRMQERAIASRARLAVQKSAKLEAKAKAAPGNRGGMLASSVGMRSSQSVASSSSTKTELEQAIETGNWQAVGAAAQRLSDQSVGELSVDEKARMRDAISQSPVFNRRRSSRDLDALIERGDWPGVIAAAKNATEDWLPNNSRESGVTEEQDALAQANMWQDIADQSKQEAQQGPVGAGDATAWAIQRSLQALDSSPDMGVTSNTTKRTITDIADEQDSGDSHYESSSFDESVDAAREGYTQSGDI